MFTFTYTATRIREAGIVSVRSGVLVQIPHWAGTMTGRHPEALQPYIQADISQMESSAFMKTPS
jgi:hypothetical protein